MSEEPTLEQIQAEYTAIANQPIPVVPENPYIITFEELQSTQEALSAKENSDRISVSLFVNPNPEDLRNKLLQWAGLGFPNIFIVSTVSLEVPSKCLDGQTRNIYSYVDYLLGTTLSEKIQILNQKLLGITISYSFQNSIVQMQVSKS
jgi:hypothetical protein